ncbi:MAG: ferrochelatase [Acidimicrobiales bacterium]
MRTESGPVGVLVMAHGTPESPADIAPFYTRIRRGRPPTPEQLADLERRYAAIGGTSPLGRRTAAQVDGLRRALARRGGGPFVVAFGAKHTAPFVEDGALELQRAGLEHVLGLVLTPQSSSLGSQEYLDRAGAALGPSCRFTPVPPWYGHPGLVALLAARVHDALAGLGATGQERWPVVFTAHSLPARVQATGDTYPAQLEASAALVAAAAGLGRWLVAWQSAGRTPEPWLGPDVADVVRGIAAAGDADGVVVCPIGFVADHLEVLYDLDIELAAVAADAGLAFARTASLNDDAAFMDVLADVVGTAARPD